MQLKKLDAAFSVLQLKELTDVDFGGDYVFFAKTDDEFSLVCETSRAPINARMAEHGWRGLKIVGVLDFGLVGIIARISGILAEAQISVFVVSTYNTDYVLIKEGNFSRAIELLADAGYEIV